MVLQEGGVKIAAAVLVADGVNGSELRGARSERGNCVDDFAQQADGDVRKSGAFCAIMLNQIVELSGKDEASTNEQRADVGRRARAA